MPADNLAQGRQALDPVSQAYPFGRGQPIPGPFASSCGTGGGVLSCVRLRPDGV